MVSGRQGSEWSLETDREEVGRVSRQGKQEACAGCCMAKLEGRACVRVRGMRLEGGCGRECWA